MPSKEKLLEVIGIQTEIIKLGRDLGNVMQLICEHVLPLIDADGATIELVEDGEMVYRAVSGISNPFLGLRLKIDSSLSGLCVRTGKTLRCDDSDLDPRVDKAATHKVGLRSMIVMPLKHEDTTVGVLKAMSRMPHKFVESDLKVLGLLSGAVASAMYFATMNNSRDLFYQATHDVMTGLANRALFMDHCATNCSRALSKSNLWEC